MSQGARNDIELASGGSSSPQSGKPIGCISRIVTVIRSLRVLRWLKDFLTRLKSSPSSLDKPRKIEDLPPGYPQFSALLASHDSFFVCRRFTSLRSRLCLLKQDRLATLEERLEKLDQGEDLPLRLRSCRSDDNSERKATLNEIDEALKDYDDFIERSRRAFQLDDAKPRHVSSLQNWIRGTGSVARKESAFLWKPKDLVNVASDDETLMPWLEPVVEDSIAWMNSCFGRDHFPEISNDPNVQIPMKASMARISRAVMTPFILLVLLAPVILCSFLESLSAKLGTVVIATTVFISILTSSTRVKSAELIVAGATYTTVLVVFISNT